jgi:hypothetical protein
MECSATPEDERDDEVEDQGKRMNAFIMYLAGMYQQPTSQKLSTPSLDLWFFGQNHEKEGL